ncbi:MAG TPA: Hsp20/alpha crystallin family protein [Thermoanaerobaculia bacterium]|jgi:HSP20 family protein|nr:Hsp20/alpha crystallin family protein [Thermoanaerobaculia bacterium]
MNLVTWDPYRELSTLQDRVNRIFGGGLARRDRDEEMSMGAWIPPVDIVEEKDRMLLTAELPGFQEKDIQIQMEGGVLTIRGERKTEEEKEGRTFHRVERSYGQFVRSFTLPNNVDRENIKADFRNGLLEIELPKREEAKPRQIKISVGSGNGQKKEAIDVKGR